MGDPVGAAAPRPGRAGPRRHRAARRALRRRRVADNLNPVGRVYYAASTLICTPASLSQEVGLALGAQAGEARLREIADRTPGSPGSAAPPRPRSTSSSRPDADQRQPRAHHPCQRPHDPQDRRLPPDAQRQRLHADHDRRGGRGRRAASAHAVADARPRRRRGAPQRIRDPLRDAPQATGPVSFAQLIEFRTEHIGQSDG